MEFTHEQISEIISEITMVNQVSRVGETRLGKPDAFRASSSQ